MHTARSEAPLDFFTGSTAHGHVWLELVEIDSPDEYVSHELAIPVDTDASGNDTLDWGGARWMQRDGSLGELVHRAFVARVRAWQAAGKVASDALLLDAWEEGGGREARVVWRLDMAI